MWLQPLAPAVSANLRIFVLSQFRAGLELSPQNPGLHYRYGAALLKQGRTKEARPYLDRAVEWDPELADAQYQLGKALIDEGRLPEAEKRFRQALQLEASAHTRMSAHYQLSQLCRRTGRRQEASEHQKKYEALKAELDK